MIKGIIFDLDGIIVDTAHYHFIAWQALAHKLGIEFTEEDNEHLKGLSRVDSLNFILNMGKLEVSEEEKIKLAAGKNIQYLDLIQDLNKGEILPGVMDWINEAEEKGIKIALGSASKNARRILTSLGINDRFEIIMDGNNVSRTKPDPEVFLLAAEGLGLQPAECVVIEDSYKGIIAGNAGNFITIGIGSQEILNNADFVYSSLSDITLSDFIKNQDYEKA